MLSRKHLQLFILLLITFFLFENVKGQWEIVGRWPYGSCNTVIADGDYIYLASGGIICVVDITNPATPVEASRIVTSDAVNGLYKEGNHLFASNRLAGFRIYDVSEPTNPIEINHVATSLKTLSIHISDGYAYVGSWNSIDIYDISDLLNPTIVGGMSGIFASDIHVQGGFLYVADGLNGLHIFDINDPSWPVEVDHYVFFGGSKLELSGNYLYATAGHDGLYIFDVSQPTAIVEVAQILETEWVWDVRIVNDIVYLATVAGLVVFNVEDPTQPQEMGRYTYQNDMRSDWEEMDVEGNFAYVTFTYGGVRIIDISDPSNPSQTKYFATSGSAFDVHICGNYAYYVNDDFHVLDISDPANPQEISSICTQEMDASSVYVYGNYAFVTGHIGLRIIDIHDAVNPFVVGSIINMQGDVRYQGVSASENYAYFIQQGLQIIDVSDPSSPVETGSFFLDDGSYPKALFVLNDYAYITYESGDQNHFKGLRIIDVSEPSNPSLIGSYRMSTDPNGVYVDNGYAYVASGDSLLIIDITELSTPTIACSYEIFCFEIIVSDGIAFVGKAWNGLSIIDVSNPLVPSNIDEISNVEAWGLGVSNGCVLVVDSDFGMFVLQSDEMVRVEEGKETSLPDNFILFQNYPNPFNSNTIIKYELQMSRHVELFIYNIHGQKVCTLVDGEQSAGEHTVDFEADNLSDGIYFYKIKVGEFEQLHKMVFIK